MNNRRAILLLTAVMMPSLMAMNHWNYQRFGFPVQSRFHPVRDMISWEKPRDPKPSASEDDFKHPLVHAAIRGYGTQVKFILSNDSPEQKYKDLALIWAVANADQSDNYYETIDALLNAGADVNTGEGSPLGSVAANGNERLLARFLKAPTVNLDSGYQKRAPLIVAVRYGQKKILEQLVNAGASFAQEDKDALLSEAVSSNKEEMVRLLIEKGANVHSGCYAYESEQEKKWRDIMTQKKDRGPYFEIEGMACILARTLGHENIVKIFTDIYARNEVARNQSAAASLERDK